MSILSSSSLLLQDNLLVVASKSPVLGRQRLGPTPFLLDRILPPDATPPLHSSGWGKRSMTYAPPGPRPEDHFPKVSKPLCERQPLLGLRLGSSEGRFGFPQQGFSTQPCQSFSYVLHAETLEAP